MAGGITETRDYTPNPYKNTCRCNIYLGRVVIYLALFYSVGRLQGQVSLEVNPIRGLTS